MPEDKMKNPYEKDGVASSHIALDRRSACGVITAFILILLLPPLYRNVYEATVGSSDAWIPITEIFKKPKDKKITQHLKDIEKQIEDKAAFTDPPRQFIQGALTNTLHEGNRKTYIGRDGWLYLQPALKAITGYGPITPEPHSVTKDPNQAPWHSPLAAIKTFAAQLDAQGVNLIIVPIPVKPTIYPEHITGTQLNTPLQHHDAPQFYQQINSLPNTSVIDLTELFWSKKSQLQLFLKQDTHWTPEAMSLAAKEVASKLQTLTKINSDLTTNTPIQIENIGDLVEQLNLPDHGHYQPESATITPINGTTNDPTSPITLLGDSFTNIYSQKSLNWGENAGFAQHLALELRQPIDTIAINGQASTGVRSELAKRGKNHLKKKKVVIWAIASRDFFLSESTARQNNVTWKNVTFPDIPDTTTKPTTVPPIEVKATLVSKSTITDPNTVTYKNALVVSEFKTTQGNSILITEWAFQNKQLTPAANRKIGDKVELNLIPFDSQTEVKGEQTFDDYEDDLEKMLLTRYWPIKKTSSDPSSTTTIATTGNPQQAHQLATIACALASALVILLNRRL